MKKMMITLALNLMIFNSLAQICSDAIEPLNEGQFTLLDSAEVLDVKTKLIWQRCSVGQSFDGENCVGDATLFTWQQALNFADQQPGLRMPNMNELHSIVEPACHSVAINLDVFPNTLNNAYWTNSAIQASKAKVVYFNFGFVGSEDMQTKRAIRLLRD